MSARFTPVALPLEGPVLLERRRFSDDRGYLTRLFDPLDLAAFGWDGPVMQVNETGTLKAGIVRGMHFQHPPHAEIKLVTCTAGRILDVAVDVRRGSPTFLRHVAVELSADNARSLLIPRGFAHGFQALTDDVRLVYVHSASHQPDAEAGLHPEDPALGIAWPLAVHGLSPRDLAHPPITSDFAGVAA
ncbi:dTDP-4-dehydrorhamnose 3,5-epimerase family protein [Gellertiella hungarica]|uniref:dTDP-4-dehydrorhamnose 3,5-epimerase n=1 Tax=Gellertiella hungarica TaxID=1572859 RepID=A0A7W6NJ31_9HYPH|nr:dTDP-4-dehydrorhamnose 3,5-epimerase [Gellertiella hungarica]MBB4063935.1 dTDP-4-dehydrorhamnose 3,5-epimerase [Gellertiella hungarica]